MRPDPSFDTAARGLACHRLRIKAPDAIHFPSHG